MKLLSHRACCWLHAPAHTVHSIPFDASRGERLVCHVARHVRAHWLVWRWLYGLDRVLGTRCLHSQRGQWHVRRQQQLVRPLHCVARLARQIAKQGKKQTAGGSVAWCVHLVHLSLEGQAEI
jgi:hypothetical protein